MPGGVLYVVATPLGNLSDLSVRAAELLRAVPVVAAEDTRRTRRLLHHLGASPRVISYHAHSPSHRLRSLIHILEGGEDLALVTDAGTPGVSDPGPELVRRVRESGGRVVPIPGPSAVAAALSAAGLPADRYLFLGFLPRSGRERRELLASIAGSRWTVVLFEAANRLLGLLEDLETVVGPDRRAVVARELTKLHEEFRNGTLADQIAYWSEVEPRGEVTVVVEGAGPGRTGSDRVGPTPEESVDQSARRLLAEGRSPRDVARELVRIHGLTRNEAYRRVLEVG